jgi:hypothetical protein
MTRKIEIDTKEKQKREIIVLLLTLKCDTGD